MEHIQEAFLGEEVSPDTPFTGYGIAKIQRLGGRVDYAAATWNSSIYAPHIVFDPNCNKGAMEKILCLYIYGRVGYRNSVGKPVEEKTVKKAVFPQLDLASMNHEDMRTELSLLHGLSEEEIKRYKNPLTRRAKVAEMRFILNGHK